MEYNNANLEGRRQFLIMELLKRTIKKFKKNIIYDHNLMSTIEKNHNKIKLASDKI